MHVALRNMTFQIGQARDRDRSSYPFASHFQTTPLSLTKIRGKLRASVVEVSAEMSTRMVGVRSFEVSVKAPPPIAVPLELP